MMLNLIQLASLLMSIIAANPSHRPPEDKSRHESPGPQCLADDPYDVMNIQGWTVRVNQRLSKDKPELCSKSLELLKFQLYQITREVPPPALNKIRQITIWLELDDQLFAGACYHPDEGWVTEHRLNPKKAHGVEIANAERFLEWEHTQPWMVLHELAHAYHDQFLPGGYDNERITAAYEHAREAKLYDAVLRNDGGTERAYAMTNRMEYFAECSEAYFGTNDFYPFVRAEFKKLDPQGFATLKAMWEMKDFATSAPMSQPAK